MVGKGKYGVREGQYGVREEQYAVVTESEVRWTIN